MAEVRNIDTRERILDAAERLFMAHGYEGTSMRQITGEAAVNLAAVNYHFGSKESLMQEVFRRRLDWLNEERMRVLNEMEAAAGGLPLKPSQIVDGFFGTLLRMADDDERGGVTFLRYGGQGLGQAGSFRCGDGVKRPLDPMAVAHPPMARQRNAHDLRASRVVSCRGCAHKTRAR